jgi:type IV pilus assembly protein PilF
MDDERGSMMFFVYSVRWLGLFFLAMVVLGCSTTESASPMGVTGADLTTESDEPDARKRARLRIELASGYFEQNKTKVALDEIKQALLSDSTYAPAYNLRGLVYMRMGELRLADESFRRALQFNPRDSNAAHNLGWLSCEQGRYDEAVKLFTQALSHPAYTARAKTFMAQGVCQVRSGQLADAQVSLTRSFELDPGNPVTLYTLAQVLFRQGDLIKSQFYLRRLNNGELANAETLWLGIQVERRLGNRLAVSQLGDQLKRRYPQSPQLVLFEKGTFDE